MLANVGVRSRRVYKKKKEKKKDKASRVESQFVGIEQVVIVGIAEEVNAEILGREEDEDL